MPLPVRMKGLDFLQYRNIEIRIVRMAPPGGWKWTVTINDKQWNGHRRDREDAILSAERFIDRRLSCRSLSFRKRTQTP
jgi:hypothetical protein